MQTKNKLQVDRKWCFITTIIFLLLFIFWFYPVFQESSLYKLSIDKENNQSTPNNPTLEDFKGTQEVSSWFAVSQTKQPITHNTVSQCQVHFIDVGMGDSELIITPHKKTILIDGGEQDSGIVDYLSSKGIHLIDIVISTHAHSDHLGGLVDVIKSIPIKNVIINGYPHPTALYNEFLDEIITTGASYTEVNQGSLITLDGAKLLVLSPQKGFPDEDINETSLMIKMDCEGIGFLFTGDAGETSEYLTLQTGLDTEAEILKIGHHGSNSATSEAFLDAVRPTVTIISVGQNDNNLPNPEVLNRLNLIGAQIFRTDLSGTIVVTAWNGNYSIAVSK